MAGAAVLDGERMAQLARQRFGDDAAARVDDWERMIATGRGQPVARQLEAANAYFNTRIRWMWDQDIYGVEDYWATPLETIGRLKGDCEDFSIAKYTSLVLMGVNPRSLRLVYVKALQGGRSQAHMVLAWYETPTSEPLILDNINPSILRAGQRQDLKPVFSFNADGLWVGGSQKSSASPTARLSRWRRVLEQMRTEGLNPTG